MNIKVGSDWYRISRSHAVVRHQSSFGDDPQRSMFLFKWDTRETATLVSDEWIDDYYIILLYGR